MDTFYGTEKQSITVRKTKHFYVYIQYVQTVAKISHNLNIHVSMFTFFVTLFFWRRLSTVQGKNK